MAAKLFGTAIPCTLAFSYVERYILPDMLPWLFTASPLLHGAVSRAMGIPALITCFSLFWLTVHGFSVGSARKTYMEKARKDGEKEVDTRYALPHLYVEGNTKHSRAFNAVQRSHQQAFETLPQLLFFVLVASAAFPLSAAAHMVLWLYGRIVWTHGYATSGGEAGKRYDHPLAFLIFASFLGLFFTALIAAVELTGLWALPRFPFA